MSNQSLLQEILTGFRARRKKTEDDIEASDRVLSKRRQEEEKIHHEKLKELTKKKATLDVMLADYHALESELEGQAQATLQERAITGEKVKEGGATLRQFYAEGMTANELKQKARADVEVKLAEAIRLIRNFRREICQIEFEAARAKEAAYRCTLRPVEDQIRRLGQEIETLKVGLAVALEGYNPAALDLDRAKQDRDLISGKFLYGMTWDLTFEELCAMRLDPRIGDAFLVELEGIIKQAKPGERYHLSLRGGIQNPGSGPSLTYRKEIPEGTTLTTTLTQEKKGGGEK